jgi:hypothetical protein
VMRYLSVCSGIEAATAAWHSLGWEAAAFSEIEAFPRAVLTHHCPDTPLHGDFTTIGADEYGAIDLLVGGTPCQSFSVAGLRGGLADERGNLALEYLRLADRARPDGWCGRTSPASCHLTEDGTLEPSSEGWRNSGMGGPTECLTLSSSEFHSAAVACSLSDILETGDVPQRYYLSATACRGILRRAAKRGKQLPVALASALTQAAMAKQQIALTPPADQSDSDL